MQADIGFAIGTGTDVAIEASDITPISGSLRGVVTAIEISKATMRNIYQNLFGAFIYNALGIPVAMGLLSSVRSGNGPDLVRRVLQLPEVGATDNPPLFERSVLGG